MKFQTDTIVQDLIIVVMVFSLLITVGYAVVNSFTATKKKAGRKNIARSARAQRELQGRRLKK